MDDLTTLLTKREELDPELEPFYDDDGMWPSIKHPLVFSIMHAPPMNALVNRQLRDKKEALARAEAEQDWRSYLFLHERPYRVDAFLAVADRMTDTEYWHNLGRIWIDSENIRQNPRVWENLLRSKRPDRQSIMSDDEQEALEELPGLILVYQGHTHRRHDGWSWTTDQGTAVWFANRFANLENANPVVTEGVVYKRNVIAFFGGRGESEIVAPRRAVRERKSRSL